MNNTQPNINVNKDVGSLGFFNNNNNNHLYQQPQQHSVQLNSAKNKVNNQPTLIQRSLSQYNNNSNNNDFYNQQQQYAQKQINKKMNPLTTIMANSNNDNNISQMIDK